MVVCELYSSQFLEVWQILPYLCLVVWLYNFGWEGGTSGRHYILHTRETCPSKSWPRKSLLGSVILHKCLGLCILAGSWL